MSDDWFRRLVAAVEEQSEKPNDSKRAISLRAGLADTYVYQMVKYGKHPSVENFIALCGALNRNPTEIIYGIELDAALRELVHRPEVAKFLKDPDGIELLVSFYKMSHREQKKLLDFLRPDDSEPSASD